MEPTADPRRRRRRLSRALGGVLLLASLVAVAYGPTLGHGFVWDDHEQVVDNQALRDPSSLGRFFRADVLSTARAGSDRSNYYRPLFFAQYLAIYQLFGLDARAWHALALLWHLAASCAAWLVLRRLGFGHGVALAAAALFVLHPAHGESVSWIAAAFNDPPASTALLLGLAGHVAWTRRRRPWGLAAGAAGYGVALLFKESALAMLLLVPLVEGWLRGDARRRVATASAVGLGVLALVLGTELLLGDAAARHAHAVAALQLAALAGGLVAAWRKLGRDRDVLAGLAPYLGLTVVYFWVRKLVLHASFGVYPGDVDTAQLLATLPLLAVHYLRFLVWPWGFAPSYPVRYVDGWGEPAVWASILGLAVAAAAVVLAARHRPVVWLAALWTLACAWPAANVRSFRPAYLVHQRYLYLAVLGLCLALAAWALGEVRRSRIRVAVLAAVAAVWTLSLWHHDGAWADDVALWTRVAEVDPGNAAAFDWLGAHALDEGRVDDAEALFRRAIAADPSSPLGHRNLAVLLHTRRGLPADALAHYRAALDAFAHRPDLAETALEAEVNYGVALAQAGRPDDALAVLLPLARRAPWPPAAVRNAGVLLRAAGRHDELLALLETAARQHPGDRRLAAMLADARRLATEDGG